MTTADEGCHKVLFFVAHVYDEVQTPSGIPVGQEKHVIINKVRVLSYKRRCTSTHTRAHIHLATLLSVAETL